MTEPLEHSNQRPLYPKLTDDKIAFMLDKQKLLQKDLAHYKKIKNKWSRADTVLKVIGISVSAALAGASIITAAPFSIPIATGILGGCSIANTALTYVSVEGFTSKRKKYFRKKCEHVSEYLNKMQVFFMRCKEDGQVTPDEFEQFQKLLKEYERGASLAEEIKPKDLKKVEKRAKKEVRQQQMNMLLHKTIQEYQQKAI